MTPPTPLIFLAAVFLFHRVLGPYLVVALVWPVLKVRERLGLDEPMYKSPRL